MFIETHVDTINENTENEEQITRTFLKSANVQAFPCGRRRSTSLEADTNSDGTLEEYRIPFDPEARLNTEANNRKHSSLNGYTQTYLKSWNEKEDGKLILSLAGYLFNITLSSYCEPNTFGNAAVTALEEPSATCIYANIVIKDTQLFQGFQNYSTEVLHNQLRLEADENEPFLDVLKDNTDAEDINNYYFSGLSFSAIPLTGIEKTRSEVYKYISELDSHEILRERHVSLCILEKDATTSNWKIYEPARLPKVEHGDIEDSVKIKHLYLDSLVAKETDSTVDIEASGNIKLTGDNSTISADKLLQNGYAVPTIELLNKGSDRPQLKITLGPATTVESN